MCAENQLFKAFASSERFVRQRSLRRVQRLTGEFGLAESVVFAFARAVESKTPFAFGHGERVAGYALRLGRAVGLSDAEQVALRKGALLHDVGKIYVSDAILNKQGPLTKDEYGVVKQHPIRGAHLVEALMTLRTTIPLIRWHHERCDGKGYPDGLVGEHIPLMARILAVADVFDVVSTDQPHRRALPTAEALAVLRRNAAQGGLDTELVGSFCEIIEAKAMLKAKRPI